MAKKERINFSKIGAIAAATGSAVGLGNIWRFPYLLGESGGGAFLLVYILCVVFLGLPVMISEFSIGRMAQANAAGSFRTLAPKSKWWLVGLMGVISAFLILGFYVVVSGWTLEYIVQALSNKFANASTAQLNQVFTDFSTNTYRPVGWMLLFTALTCFIIIAGVKNGIEKSTKLMMPLLFLIIIILGIRSITLPNGTEGLKFLFKADFGKIDSEVILNAMGQAFFSLSLGMGCMITYGSYINKDNNLSSTALQVTIFDTLVAVLASIAIFPAVFSFGINPAQGPELVFITLPHIFSQMQGSTIWSTLFFILLALASLTSTISLLEVIVAFLTEELHISRAKAAIVSSLGIALLGILSSFSLGIWKDFSLFGYGFFALFDSITSKILMPVGGIFISLFVGWRIDKQKILLELTSNGKYKIPFLNIFLLITRYLAPLAILLVLLNQLGLTKWLGF
ncbi:MAG TPA: sodium-dependent transporter [Paludibacteraceae bacterium]|nr:sodium-dependent transporter [Paludibacteraceae bacterium]